MDADKTAEKRCHYGNWLLIKSFFYPDCHVLDVGTERLKDYYTTVQNVIFAFSFYYFEPRAIRVKTSTSRNPPKKSEANLRDTTICKKAAL